MNNHWKMIFGKSALAAALLVAAALASAQASGVKAAGQIYIEGKSTLHPYASTATQVGLTVDFDPQSAASLKEAVRSGKMKKLELSVPVKDMKSGHGQLDKNMASTLKADKFPEIRFTLSEYKTGDGENGAFWAWAKGKLVVAGVERVIELKGEGKLDDQELSIEGVKDVLMSDYGIKPPTMMLGAIKTEDKVNVHFKVSLKGE